NNSCLRSGETALYSEFEFEGAIVSSNIVDGAANGISLVNFNGGGRMGTVTGNIIRNLSTEGPYPADKPGFGVGITVEADVAVSGNTVENAPRYGMHLGWGPYLRNVTATGNVIRRAGTGIAVSVVEGAGRAVITGNIIEGARNGAIVGYRWAEPATRDLAGSGASGFDHLTIERNSVS
ncbi:MAG: TIGR03808 family TAT-translocated repetitive protein, partial [Notoacmeibacter sp.]|nr:TIGR03808 family TAT-translocated repetitive protein [Notoacmeibacter sp.]